MSDVTPKKRPQRPAAPLWAARRRFRSEGSEARGHSASEDRTSAIPSEPGSPPTSPDGSQIPRAPVPRSALTSEVDDGEWPDAEDVPSAVSPTSADALVSSTPSGPDVKVTLEVPSSAGGRAASSPPIVTPRAPSSQAITAPNATPSAAPKSAATPVSAPPKSAATPVSAPPKATEASSSGEPEAVSFSEIQSLLSPGKAPPRLPGATSQIPGAGSVAPRGPASAAEGGAARSPLPRPGELRSAPPTAKASGPEPITNPAATRRVAEPLKMAAEPITNPAVTRRATEPPRPSFEAARSAARPSPSTPAEPRRAPTIPPAPRTSGSVRPLPSADAESVPASARAGDMLNESAAAQMAALAPAPRPVPSRVAPRSQPYDAPPPSTLERPPPNPLESSAADLELMAAIAAVPTKRPSEKLAWAPPKAPSQARAQTVAVLSSQATAALKGEKLPSGSLTGTGQWRAAVPITTQPQDAAVLRRTTLRSQQDLTERTASAKPSVVVIPPAPAKVGAPSAPPPTSTPPSETDATSGDVSLRETESDALANAAIDATSGGVSLRETESDAFANAAVAAAARAMGAHDLRDNPRGSLPDTGELLRDAPVHEPRRTGRGSVVDPLELYGALPPSEKPPEQSLPKVMVQVPAKSSADPSGFGEARSSKAGVTAASARAAAETKAAHEAAEARAAAASAEATRHSKPNVDLPPRVEPRPFPKPPPRRIGATETGEHPRVSVPTDTPKPETKPVAHAPSKPETKREAKPETKREAKPETKREAKPIIKVPPLPVPHKPLDPSAIWDVGPLDDAPLGDDEIPIEMTPDAPDAGAPSADAPTTDSGRFDLQQLMATAPRSNKKGLADNDLLSLAGDLFVDTSPAKIVPADLSALPKRGVSTPPPPSPPKLIAPVALAPTKKTPAVSEPPPFARPAWRAYAPWALLPVIAAGAAAIMIWQGNSGDASGSGDTTATTASGTGAIHEPPRDGTPPQNAGGPSPDKSAPTTTSSATDSGDKSKTETGGASTSWRWTGSTPGTAASTGAAPGPTAPATATTTTATKTAAPVDTAPPSGGNEFNQSAAKAALRAAAGSAAGCASDKPGTASVAITFAPSGRVTSSVVSGSFAGTTTGGCIASAMRSASVPPFDGGPVSVVWKVTLR